MCIIDAWPGLGRHVVVALGRLHCSLSLGSPRFRLLLQYLNSLSFRHNITSPAPPNFPASPLDFMTRAAPAPLLRGIAALARMDEFGVDCDVLGLRAPPGSAAVARRRRDGGRALVPRRQRMW